MQSSEIPALYTSLDLDGVVFGQIPIHVSAMAEGVWHGGRYVPAAEPDAPLERALSSRWLNPAEISALAYVYLEFPQPNLPILLRTLPRRVQPHLDRLGAKEHRLVFNTARLYHPAWVSVTWNRLADVGVDSLFDMRRSVFRPDGVDPHISKRDGVKRLIADGSYVLHVDDNPYDAFAVASVDRQRVFTCLVTDLTNGYIFSRQELDQHPNLTRVASLHGAVGEETLAQAVAYFSKAA